MNNENKSWSEGLQQETRKAITEMRINLDGKLHFKSHGNGGAFITAHDLMRGKLSLTHTENGQVNEFANINELLAAGWPWISRTMPQMDRISSRVSAQTPYLVSNIQNLFLR